MSVFNFFEMSFASLLIQKEINHHLYKQAMRTGLSVLELQVLWIVAVMEEVVSADIVAIIGQCEGEPQSVLAFLEGEGFISKIHCNESRKLAFAATDRGLKLVQRIIGNKGIKYSMNFVDDDIAYSFTQAARTLYKVLTGYEMPALPSAQELAKTHKQTS